MGKANHLPRLHGDAASIFMGLASNSAVPHQLEQGQTSCLNNGMNAALSFPVINAVLMGHAMQRAKELAKCPNQGPERQHCQPV